MKVKNKASVLAVFLSVSMILQLGQVFALSNNYVGIDEIKTAFDQAVALQMVNDCTAIEDLDAVLTQNYAVLEIDLSVYNSISQVAKNNALEIMLQNKPYSYVNQFDDCFNQDVIIAKINTCVSWIELKSLLIENNAILHLDLSQYNSLSGSTQSYAIQYMTGHTFISVNEISMLFNNAVAQAIMSETPVPTNRSGGSSGGGSGSGGSSGGSSSSSGMPVYMWDIGIDEIDKTTTTPQSGSIINSSVYLDTGASGVLVFSLCDTNGKIMSVKIQQISQQGKYTSSFTVPQNINSYEIRAYLLNNLSSAIPLSYVSKRRLTPFKDYVVQSVDNGGNVTCKDGTGFQLISLAEVYYQNHNISSYSNINEYFVLSSIGEGLSKHYNLSESILYGTVLAVDQQAGTITLDIGSYDADFDTIAKNGAVPTVGSGGRFILNSRRAVVAFAANQ